jgi:hypothetical protein
MRTAFSVILSALFFSGCSQNGQRLSSAEVAAVQLEAQATLTNLIHALETAKTNLVFGQVCTLYTPGSGGAPQLVWFSVGSFDGTSFAGMTTGSRPDVGLTNGQPVRIAATSVVDWSYLSRTGIVGRLLDKSRR